MSDGQGRAGQGRALTGARGVSIARYDAIVDACCDAWNGFVGDVARITFTA